MANDKKVEDKYRKLDDVSHVLLRPGMYLGSIKPNNSPKWIIEGNKVAKKDITYIPAFIKLFDEILMNSVDENKRPGSKLNSIKVSIDKSNGMISIYDNGGIIVTKHKEHNEWIPEMIFSNLRAGSNFNDDEERTGAGTNGVGSSLTNIFSKTFKVSTCDGTNHFEQTFSNNMRERTEPKIKKSTKNHTEISYLPDFERFGMTGIDDDHFRMIEKRVYDIAACNPKIKIYFNETLINFKSFEDYIKMYKDSFFFESNKDKTWSIGISNSDNGFQQVSFVNSTETYDGGTHIDYITNQIVSQLREFFLKKHKVDIKPGEIKNHIFLFLDSTVINPSFNSQTKEKLITEIKDFGFTYEVSQKMISSILKSEIVNSILDWIQQKKNADESKLQRELNKKISKVKVEKLIDAKGKDRMKCEMFIFEGDCLEENTEIRIIDENGISNKKIKDVKIDDLVITHNNNLHSISAISKKISKKTTIKTSDGSISCSPDHRFYVYDTIEKSFKFKKSKDINIKSDKLVKNYLHLIRSLTKIKNVNIIIGEKYNRSVVTENGIEIITNSDHKFCIYDNDDMSFKMMKIDDVNINKHFIVEGDVFGKK